VKAVCFLCVRSYAPKEAVISVGDDLCGRVLIWPIHLPRGHRFGQCY
jgi:hypothetical protein